MTTKHLIGTDRQPMCGDKPWHFITTPRFGDTTCIRCVVIVRDEAKAHGLGDPCATRITPAAHRQSRMAQEASAE